MTGSCSVCLVVSFCWVNTFWEAGPSCESPIALRSGRETHLGKAGSPVCGLTGVSWQLARAGEPGQADLLGKWPTLAHFHKLTKTSVLYWRRQWQPTPVLLPGKSHGRRSLVGCSPWGREESDTTERLHFHFSLSCIGEGNGNPLQCSCLENLRDGGAWWAAVYGVAQSRTRLK